VLRRNPCKRQNIYSLGGSSGYMQASKCPILSYDICVVVHVGFVLAGPCLTLVLRTNDGGLEVGGDLSICLR
jgi:hypothetical protein